MKEVHQVAALLAKVLLDLSGNPMCTIAQTVGCGLCKTDQLDCLQEFATSTERQDGESL